MVPVRLMDCGLPATVSLTDTVPGRVPALVGVKVTSMVQVAPGFNVPPEYGQEVGVVASAKLPLATILVMPSAAVPALVRVAE